MTVCLTGDVHHMSMETRDQAYMDRTEVEAAIEYAEIASEYDVPVTLFLTGKCVVEERDRVRKLAEMENVELGGHNYWAFTTPIHKIWRAVGKATDGRIGSWNGPKFFQHWEIGKTVSAFEELGTPITSWRDHGYRHDHHTASLLEKHGITHFSDPVEPNGHVRTQNGITVVPVNTPPDHEHLYHAFRTPEFVAEGEFEGPFGTESYGVEVWAKWVQKHVDTKANRSSVATLLVHPACMDLADGFSTFRAVLDHIKDRKKVTVSNIESPVQS